MPKETIRKDLLREAVEKLKGAKAEPKAPLPDNKLQEHSPPPPQVEHEVDLGLQSATSTPDSTPKKNEFAEFPLSDIDFIDFEDDPLEAEHVKSQHVSEYDNIPISKDPALRQSLMKTLEETVAYLEKMIENTLKVQTQPNERPSERPAKRNSLNMALGYNSSLRNPQMVQKKKLENVTNLISAIKRIILRINQPELTTTHLMDFLDEVFESYDINREICRQINSNTKSGYFITYIEETIEKIEAFIEKAILDHQQSNPQSTP